MKRMMIVVAALLMASPLFAQQKTFLDQPYIEVTGRAEMEVAPDEIYVRITINEQDSKGKTTVLQQEKDMVRRLKDLGIDVDKKLVVQDMMNAQLKKDVATSKSYMLEVNSATQLAHVFQALQTIGISDAAVERTDVSNMDELRQQVRGASAKAARQNAEILAAALGQKVGKAIFVQDNSYYSRPYSNVVLTRTMKVADAGVAATAAPTLEFQKITIDHSVLVRFMLE
jgi:uncharacterized protein YggE